VTDKNAGTGQGAATDHDAAAEPAWLAIGRELKAIAQIGLTFTRDPYDRERYERIRELAAAVIAQGAGHDASSLLEAFRVETGYATPKVDVRAAAFDAGRILLVREVSDGAWTLPGGWADVNESPSVSAVREVAEESGFEARAIKLAAVYDYRKRNRPQHLDSIYKLFFICELTGGSARPSIETSEVAFFARDEVPNLSVGRTTAAQIERMFAHAEEPGLPTDFD
jgi:ADP-ribose pyrophosphatase YjhB (NUDIX family)